MPVTIIDRLPLPNLKVYSAGSVLLLSVAVYYAVNITSDPNWRVNVTLHQSEPMEHDVKMSEAAGLVSSESFNATRNLTEHVVEVMTFMMHEPLCMWTLINMAYCSLALALVLVRRAVFGPLRVSEAQRVKDKFWNYLFYKFIFVFGVLNVQYMDEVLMWCCWFTLVGALLMLTQLCKDRFEYLSSSPGGAPWAHGRLLGLLGGILAAGAALLGAACRWGLPAGRDTFAFMAAECVLACVSCVHVVAGVGLRARDADPAGPLSYYTHLLFDAFSLILETAHVGHMVVHSNAMVSMASLVLLMQLRQLLHALLARLRRHRIYAALAHHMSRNYPMASPEEVEKNEDNCAICWEPMKEARKLPCAHLFHNSCLCRWVQQDASCPTCRRALSARPRAPHGAHPPGPALSPNHLFHFDGSRYVSWLPSFSVEVTRVRAEPPAAPAPPAAPPSPALRPSRRLELMLSQVQGVFPQYSAGALRAELARTGSALDTVHNILDGRLEHTLTGTDTAALARREGTSATSPPPPPSSSSPSVPVTDGGSHCATDSESSEEIRVEFSKSASEREALLRRRKQQMVSAARRHYLLRQASARS